MLILIGWVGIFFLYYVAQGFVIISNYKLQVVMRVIQCYFEYVMNITNHLSGKWEFSMEFVFNFIVNFLVPLNYT